jgi:hypothetical protein
MEVCNLSFSLDETLSEWDRQKRERESDRRKRKIT